jgi:hypothetical protein
MAIQDAHKCGAKNKRSGTPCQSATMPNGRYRLPGGMTPGGFASPHFKHGRRSKYSHEAWAWRLQRYRRCLALKANGERCHQWAVISDPLRRCPAHQNITAEELFLMRVNRERWFRKKWIRKSNRRRQPKAFTEEQLGLLSQVFADLKNEAEELGEFPFEMSADLSA